MLRGSSGKIPFRGVASVFHPYGKQSYRRAHQLTFSWQELVAKNSRDTQQSPAIPKAGQKFEVGRVLYMTGIE